MPSSTRRVDGVRGALLPPPLLGLPSACRPAARGRPDHRRPVPGESSVTQPPPHTPSLFTEAVAGCRQQFEFLGTHVERLTLLKAAADVKLMLSLFGVVDKTVTDSLCAETHVS